MQFLTYAVAAIALLAANTLRADDNQAVSAALAFTRAFAEKHHLAAAVELRDRKGKTTTLQYDRVGDAERVRNEDGTFARREGGEWLSSDDWAESGTPLGHHEAEELEELGGIVEGVLNTKDDPSLRTWHVVEEAKRDDGRLVVYQATRAGGGAPTYPRLTFEQKPAAKSEEALLQRIDGPVFAGADVMVAAIRLVYGSGLDKAELLPPNTPHASVSPHQ